MESANALPGCLHHALGDVLGGVHLLGFIHPGRVLGQQVSDLRVLDVARPDLSVALRHDLNEFRSHLKDGGVVGQEAHRAIDEFIHRLLDVQDGTLIDLGFLRLSVGLVALVLGRFAAVERHEVGNLGVALSVQRLEGLALPAFVVSFGLGVGRCSPSGKRDRDLVPPARSSSVGTRQRSARSRDTMGIVVEVFRGD